MHSQFIPLTILFPDLILIISFELLSSAYSVSYITAFMIFTKDLIKQSISLFSYFSKTLKLSEFTSFTIIDLLKLSLFFARVSALLFYRLLLCLLTFIRLRLILFAL